MNTYTSGLNVPLGEGICHQPDGSFVITWESQRDFGTSIQGQRYAGSGSLLGMEFQVSTYTSAYLSDPAVCCSEGGFVVVWSGPARIRDRVLAGGTVFGRRFNSAGAVSGTEFQINTYSAASDFAFNPDVCCSADGDFVVVWNQGSFFTGNHDSAVVWQRFASDGSTRGTEFVVNSYTTGTYAVTPGICCDAAGDFIVAWTRGSDDAADVFGQRYTSSGSARGSEFQVNTYTSGLQGVVIDSYGFIFENEALCCDRTGDFIVAWSSESGDDNGADIFAQRFARDGTFRGAEFQVNVHSDGDQEFPALCCGPAGDFVVVWQDQAEPYSFTSANLAGRRFSSAGQPSDEFQVNVYSSAQFGPPAISCDPKGGFVVAWGGSAGRDSGANTFARRFGLLLTDISAAPALSVLGLVGGVVALLIAAARTMRRRS